MTWFGGPLCKALRLKNVLDEINHVDEFIARTVENFTANPNGSFLEQHKNKTKTAGPGSRYRRIMFSLGRFSFK